MEMFGKLKQIAGPIAEHAFNFEEKKMNLKRKLRELESIEADVTTQLEVAEYSSGKKRKNEVANWLGYVQRTKNEVHSLEMEMGESSLGMLLGQKVQKMTGVVVELIEKGRFPAGLVLDVVDTSGDELITTRLVGEAFQTNKDKIWEWLIKDEVLSIGIFGMGGVGKSTLMTHIHNLIKESRTFNYVDWIIVSQDFSIHKLQHQIARNINLDLSTEDDVRKRAAKLSKALSKRGKSVLILDDLWNDFTLEEVGIPIRVNGCKLILTTRSLDICQRMGCQEKIKVEPLSEEEAWDLFKDKLGKYMALPLEVKKIAESVAKECVGLPLGIITMAGSMRGVNDLHEWKNLLVELKDSEFRQVDMDNEVFRILKFSYFRLNDSAVQQCLLYCALFPEDYKIAREELIEHLILEGIIKGMKNRQAEIDRGHAMLNKLVNVCLLENYYGLYVKMHDLIRDMAIDVMKLSTPVMIEAGAQLTEVPDDERWTEDLVRVSLMENNINKIPSSVSPKCPNLKSLLLGSSHWLALIESSFFHHLDGLNILDLSHTSIQELPVSISGLVNLTALILSGCSRLRHVPSLAKHKSLKKLDLSKTALEQVPEGMEFLLNLRYLDMYETRLKEFPVGLLPKLSHLQFFNLSCTRKTFVMVKAEEVASLKKLEYFYYNFSDFREHYSYFQALAGCQQLTVYSLLVGKSDNLVTFNRKFGRQVFFNNCSIGGGEDVTRVFLPKDIQILQIFDCSACKSLCLVNATDLNSLVIRDCDGIKFLFSMPSCHCVLQNLERLNISSLDDLQDIFITDGGIPPTLTSNGTFSHLRELRVQYCSSLRKMLPLHLLPDLQNLEIIEVSDCLLMEKIFGVEDEEKEGESNFSTINPSIDLKFRLPRLWRLVIEQLPGLKSICSTGKLICDSLEEIRVVNCPKLKKIPILLPLPSLKQICGCPEEWWESVEWDHTNAKNGPEPFCVLRAR